MRAACPEIGRVDDIPNGVDTARFAKLVGRPADLHPVIEPRRYFLFIGRLELRKAVDILLHATSNILDRCPHHVVIAGKGPKAEELEQLAQRLGLSSRVHFLGQVQGDAKTYLLQNSLATVVCSRFYEGLPLVVLESYASGRPVIATDVPGMVDVIHHEETGLCVPQENSAALAHAMLQTALNPQRAEQWGSNARKLAQSYDWSNVARRHLELFAELKARKDKLAA
jgi:glycosyltransferase involved in cell wall biosynthesis